VPTPPAPAVQDPLDSIARFEDMRSDGEGLLQVLAVRGEVRTRTRAVRALGRLPLAEYGASVSDALVDALEDEDPGVRETAAFALGMRGDPSTVQALVGAIDAASDVTSNALRARCVEALSRIDDPRARRAVTEALFANLSGAPSVPSVAQMAALGIQRFPKAAPEAAAAEAELVRFTAALRATPDDEESLWRALSTLARRAVVGARAEFERGATSSSARVRIFALQGLGSIPTDPRAAEILRARLADPDWRVACEAANALGKHAESSAVPALLEATTRSVPPQAAHHVQRCAFEALGRIPDASDAARSALERARNDPSPSVRAAAIEAGARMQGLQALAAIEAAALDANPVVRAGAAAASAHLPSTAALVLLERLVLDIDLRVATTAVDACAIHAADPAIRSRLRELLAAEDNGVRLSAATALKDTATHADLPAFELALTSTRGEIAPEVAAAIVDAAAKIGGEPGLVLLRRAAVNQDPYVARKARAAALAIRADATLPRAPTPPKRSSILPPAHSGPNPRVVVETTRGTLVFELLPDEAPFHVVNLLELASRGHYDGTRIHRVVPDFVVQGGDRRGDGNGGTTWRGDALRGDARRGDARRGDALSGDALRGDALSGDALRGDALSGDARRGDALRGDALRGEFGPRPFRRGSLGMPRNDDSDSGGSQIFVTHRETPHLDGRYTLFGELIEGFDVLDALQIGDEIRTIRPLASGS